MTKARDLANIIAAGNPLADGAISVAEVTGAAPLASPTFTGTATVNGNITVTGTVDGRDIATNIPASLGTAGQVLTVNSGETAGEWADAASGGATVELTASGAIAANVPVIINTDGTVSSISETAQAIGTPVQFDDYVSDENASTFDSSNNKVVVFARNSSSYPYAKVGTVSGTSISFGSAVVVKSSFGQINIDSATFDTTNNKVIFAWSDGFTGPGTAVVGTVSGTSISFGTPVVFNNASTDDICVLYDSNAEKVVIGYRDRANSFKGTAIVGTVSGTSISFGSEAIFENANIEFVSGAFDSNNNKVVFAYQDEGNSSRGTAVVGTVSGTSITFGTPAVFNTSYMYEPSVVFDNSANKIVIAYRPSNQSNHGMAVVATVDGTSITFGVETKFEASTVENPAAVFDPNAKKVNIFFDNSSDNNLQCAIGVVSGNDITFDSDPVVVDSEQPRDQGISPAFDSNSNVIATTFRTAGNPYDTETVIFRNSATSLKETNFIGFSDAAYSDAATANIQLKSSVNTGQSGLTTGSTHYVQRDGTLSTAEANPSVVAGIAISATKIIVKG